MTGRGPPCTFISHHNFKEWNPGSFDEHYSQQLDDDFVSWKTTSWWFDVSLLEGGYWNLVNLFAV